MAKQTKVGIMTWYQYKNYGSVLQAYALSKIIGDLNYNPEFINYISPQKTKDKESYTLKEALNKILKLFNGLRVYHSEDRNRVFNQFVKENLVQSDFCSSYAELFALNDDYEAFLCGSDQIWAPSCFDEKFFLSFVENKDKMIAYAPSFGLQQVENPLIKKRMGELISRFNFLSVREKEGKYLMKNLWDIDAVQVLDPTLLLSANTWDELFNASEVDLGQLVKGKYIFCYFLGDYRKYMKYVKQLAKKLGYELCIIPMFNGQLKMSDEVFRNVSPQEFVYLLKNAGFVCTDSFHGTAFAVNYNIPFSVFERFSRQDKNNQNSRIYSLLELVGLKDYIVSPNSKKIQIRQIDFHSVNKILVSERKKSIMYLKNALNKASLSKNKNLNFNFHITETCCGCGSCASVCPKYAINFKLNDKGFWQYNIDKEKCIECSLCQKVCPFCSPTGKNIDFAEALYALKSNTKEVLRTSSSGGAGYEIANFIFKQEGVVCGCRYNPKTDLAEHIIIKNNDSQTLKELQGSKYIQSISYKCIEELAHHHFDKKVVFFGTPCQVAGIDKVLRKQKRRDDFVLVDLICHGVPSVYLWRKYLKEFDAGKGNGTHSNVQFRDKSVSWRSKVICIQGYKKMYKENQYRDDFYAFFERGQCYMESCYECPYRLKSSADIRIGDYWGKQYSKDKEGVSMVITMTKRGNDIISMLQKQKKVQLTEKPIEDYRKIQYPQNYSKPLYYNEMINKLKFEECSLKEIRREYYFVQDKWEYLKNMFSV